MGCKGIYREMEMEMEMEMLMERTLGMLVGAELVQQYDKLEKCTNTHHGSGPL